MKLFGLALLAAVAYAQTTPVVLDIEVENVVRYIADVPDPSKLALNATVTPAAATRAFTDTIFVGDIVAINGRPAKGLWTSRQYIMNFAPTAAPGAAVADAAQGAIAECKYELLNESGALIGRLMDGGLFPHAVTGGTGAFLGARGEQATATARVVKAVRLASMAEDPANRRINGGGNVRILMRLVPAFRPSVAAVVHQDGRAVSSGAPAQPGEVLTLYATGLGPTTPAVDFGQPFGKDRLHTANAPVTVTIDGKAAEVIWAGGYPDAVDGYQVNFRMPAELPTSGPRNVSLAFTAAWIPGADVMISVR